MATETQTAPRQTALNAAHRALKAKMVNFAGWDMPVEYSGIIPEHLAVRGLSFRRECSTWCRSSGLPANRTERRQIFFRASNFLLNPVPRSTIRRVSRCCKLA